MKIRQGAVETEARKPESGATDPLQRPSESDNCYHLPCGNPMQTKPDTKQRRTDHDNRIQVMNNLNQGIDQTVCRHSSADIDRHGLLDPDGYMLPVHHLDGHFVGPGTNPPQVMFAF